MTSFRARPPAVAILCSATWEENAVLYPIAVVLFVLWLLGLVGGYTIGAFIHVLLVIALILVLVQFLRGRRVA
jgi:hypothetical protein